jgi:hypothetical protein
MQNLKENRLARRKLSELFNSMKAKANGFMSLASHSLRGWPQWIALSVLAVASLSAHAQSCQTSGELDDATRSAITAAGQRYFGLVAKGDVASLRQNAMASLASDFSGIETSVKDHQQDLAGAQATVKSIFVLESPNPPAARGEFYCGVFGKTGQTSDSAVIYLDNLPSGKYGIVLLDATSTKGRIMFSLVLQQAGSDWKLGGLYVKPALVAGHDGEWFLARAREYKTKGQLHNGWFYYLEGRDVLAPASFIATLATDKIDNEFQSLRPADLPGNGKTVDLGVGTGTYKLTAIFPEVVGKDLDLIVKYQAADVSNTNQAYQNNVSVMKALVTKYPEVREVFAAVVARAVDPSGHDYGTLLAMKDIK